MKNTLTLVFTALVFTVNAQYFTKVTTGDIVSLGRSTSSSWGDYDGDGDLDVFAFCNPSNALFRNDCNGNFTKVVATALSTSTSPFNSVPSEWIDYDNDGDLDIILYKGLGGGVPCAQIYNNDGSGNFTAVASTQLANDTLAPRTASIVDFDNDGYLDVFIANSGRPNVLYRNTQTGDFTKVTGSILNSLCTNVSNSSSWGDYDNDGDMDVFIGGGGGTSCFYQNNGDGTFTQINNSAMTTVSGSNYGPAWVDYDNDGDLDLFLQIAFAPNLLFMNNNNNSFTQVTVAPFLVGNGLGQAGPTFGDYDNDGDLDLFLANVNGNPNKFYVNNGDGTFTDNTTEIITNDSLKEAFAASFADIDNDGDLDLYVNNVTNPYNDNRNFLYLNNASVTSNKWFKIKCIGTQTNKQAIGARVYVKAIINGTLVTQMREINGNSNLSGGGNGVATNEVHFGLGNATVIQELKIVWPKSGTIQVFNNVALNQFASITEGLIAITTHILCGHPSSFCANAIPLPINNSLINASQTEGEKWFSFVATASTAKIFVDNKSDLVNGRIGSVQLYSGSCNNLQLIGEASLAQDTSLQRLFGDSLLLFSDKLVAGQSFFLKTQKVPNNSNVAMFDLQINNFSPGSTLSCAVGFNNVCFPVGPFVTFTGPGFGNFAWGIYFFQLTQTSGNLNIQNFQVSANACDGNLYPVANNFNSNFHPLICIQGFTAIDFSGIIPANSEGQQYCFKLSMYNNIGQLVCETNMCIKSSDIHPLASNTASVCSGQCKLLTANGSAGTGSYTWTTGSITNPTVVATTANFNACPTVNTTYTVSLSKPASCVIPSQSVAITVYPSFNVTLSPPVGAICNGQSITINSSISPVQSGNTYTYNWSNGSTSQNLTIIPVNTSTYTLTVTDSNGCSASSTVTINPAGAITLNPSTSPVCANPSVAITASGGSTYTWSGAGLNTTTGATVIATPTIPTTYTVTSTSSGCSATITVNPAPNTAFTVNRFDNCEGKAIVFSHLPASGVIYTWDFGDGTPPVTGTAASASNINHTFTPSGYYLVTLKATSVPCPVQSSSQIVYITPSSTIPPYNPNCCISGYTGYDFVDLVFDPSQLNSDWIGVNYKIKGTITIKAGMIFNINNSTISFGPQGQVIVEPTAILRLNGTTLTSIDYGSVCGSASMRMMWQGVEVWGNNSDGNLSAQGQLIMNNSTIEDAYNGVTLGKSLFTIGTTSATNGVGFKYNDHDFTISGGVIRTTNSATFNRNGIGVRMWEYQYNSFSQLFNCNFYCKTSGVNGNVLDPHYNSSYITTMNNSTKYKAHNPQQTIFILSGQSAVGLYARGVKRVLMRTNVFDNANLGILSFTSRHDIPSSFGSPNSFKNLQYGVYIYSTMSPISPRNIVNNTFSNTDIAIADYGGTYDNIKTNTFGLTTEAQMSTRGSAKVGILTSSAQNFNIVDNTYNNLFWGVQCDNSQTSSLIGYENFGNSFIKCRYGLFASGDNSRLNVLCNSHENQVSASYNDPASSTSNINGRIWSLTGKLKNQGNPPGTVTGTPSAKDPAGNTFNFSNKLASRKDIFANTSPATFNYYYHRDVDAFTRPDVIKQYGSGTGQNGLNSNYIRLSDNVSFANIQSACAPVVDPGCNPSCKLNVLNTTGSQIAQLTTQFNAAKATLDHGNTQLLLNSIGPVGNNFKVSGSGSSSPGQLKDLLLANSLLSDTVIMAVINKADPLPPGIFQDIIIPNSPVSDYILPHLINKLATLPPGIEKKILDAQTSSHVRTLSVIARQIEYTQKTRQLMLNSLVSHYASADSMPQAIALLEAEHTQEANKILIAEYLADGNLLAAQTKLNTLATTDPADAAYVSLYNLYLNLAQNNKTVWQMDSSQHAFVKQLALGCPSTLAAINARSLLILVYGERVAPCPGIYANAKLAATEVINESVAIEQDKMYLGNNIPNPFNGHTLIPYYLPSGVEKGAIKIFSVEGKLVKSYEVKQAENMIEVSLDEMEGGVYFYCLEMDGTVMQTRKMILIK